MTGDEELTGEPLAAAREALVAEAKKADIAIGFENGPGDPQHRGDRAARDDGVAAAGARRSRRTRRRSSARTSARARSTRRRASCTAFRETLGGEPHLTFNPGVMLGGTAADLDVALARGTASGKENVDRRRRPS